MSDLHNLTAFEALEKIKKRELTVLEYTTALLERSKKLSYLNAYITLNEQQILDNARLADLKIEEGSMTDLFGLPIAVKDNINTKSIRTTGGTPALKDFVPQTNNPVVQRMLNHNGIIFGKTNMHELAFGITTNNAFYGSCRNPYNHKMHVGGSSGGTACAVAARLVPIGYGTDTGGSCRIPASVSGCVGYRPTTFRYSQEGVIPLSYTRDTIGILARTVKDIAMLDDFSYTDGQKQDRKIEVNPKKLRVGVPRRYFYEDLDKGTEVVVEAALQKLREAGVELIEADMDQRLYQLNEDLFFIVGFEAVRDLAIYMIKSGVRIPIQDIIDNVGGEIEKEIFGSIIKTPNEFYVDLLQSKRPLLQQIYKEYFETNAIDCFIIPTTCLPARPIGQDRTVELNGKQVSTLNAFKRNTDPSSNAGVPCLTIPAGLTPETKLPVGVELTCLFGQDAKLLAIGEAVQGILGEIPAPNI